MPVDCEAARLLPSLPSDLLAPEPVASAVVTDPRNGQVLAIVGGVLSRTGNGPFGGT